MSNQNDKTLLPYGHVVFVHESGASKARKFQGHVLNGKKVSITVHKINVQKKLGSELAAINDPNDLMHSISRPYNPLSSNNNLVLSDREKNPHQSVHLENNIGRIVVRKNLD